MESKTLVTIAPDYDGYYDVRNIAGESLMTALDSVNLAEAWAHAHNHAVDWSETADLFGARYKDHAAYVFLIVDTWMETDDDPRMSSVLPAALDKTRKVRNEWLTILGRFTAGAGVVS